MSYLALELDLLFILCGSQQAVRSSGSETLTLYGAYHFASRVFPLQVSDVSQPWRQVPRSGRPMEKRTAGSE